MAHLLIGQERHLEGALSPAPGVLRKAKFKMPPIAGPVAMPKMGDQRIAKAVRSYEITRQDTQTPPNAGQR